MMVVVVVDALLLLLLGSHRRRLGIKDSSSSLMQTFLILKFPHRTFSSLKPHLLIICYIQTDLDLGSPKDRDPEKIVIQKR